MLPFIAGLIMIYIGYKILKRSTQSPPLQDEAIAAKLREIHDMTARVEAGRKLDQLLVTDAMARELRAKTALLALLQKIGASEAGIQKVMNAVENAEGDETFEFPIPSTSEGGSEEQ